MSLLVAAGCENRSGLPWLLCEDETVSLMRHNQSVQLRLPGMWPSPKLDSILIRLERRFDKLRRKLVAEHENRYALLFNRGSRLVPELQIFDDQWDAINAGYLDPEHRRFCVKRIVLVDEPVYLRPVPAIGL